MRKKIWYVLIGIITLLSIGTTFAIEVPWEIPDPILTTEHTSIITPPDDNAIREGTRDIIHSENGQYKVNNLLETQEKIETQADATKRTLNIVHRLINYALGLVSFVALVVLIFAGFQIVTAWGDDNKAKAGNKALKKVSIGIIGLAISRMIVSFIFWILYSVML